LCINDGFWIAALKATELSLLMQQICPEMSSAVVACDEEVANADWTHVKNCTSDVCKAAFKLQNWTSLAKYM